MCSETSFSTTDAVNVFHNSWSECREKEVDARKFIIVFMD